MVWQLITVVFFTERCFESRDIWGQYHSKETKYVGTIPHDLFTAKLEFGLRLSTTTFGHFGSWVVTTKCSASSCRLSV